MSDRRKSLAKFVDEVYLSDEFFCLCGRLDTFASVVDGSGDNIAGLIASVMRDDKHIADVIHKAQNIYLASQIVDNGIELCI